MLVPVPSSEPRERRGEASSNKGVVDITRLVVILKKVLTPTFDYGIMHSYLIKINHKTGVYHD